MNHNILGFTLKFCVLASGSKGNSTLIEADGSRILIDAGLSAKAMAARLSLLGVDPESIDALVISHEHTDHIRGVDVWCKRFGTRVYTTPATHKAVASSLGPHVRVAHFKSGHAMEIGPFRMIPFHVSHDAEEPVGFVIETNGSRLGVVTDLGCATSLVRERLQRLDALILESNHDMRMLMEGPYPWPVKDRIRRNHGHLSNEQSAKLLACVAHSGLQAVVLAHLSEINNLPEIALESAAGALDGRSKIKLCVGRQDYPTDFIALK